MGFAAVIIDSPPFKANVLEAIEFAEWAARRLGKRDEANRFHHLGGQLRDLAATGGRG